MIPAVFFDRDGVINKPVFSEKYNEAQPPHHAYEVKFYDETIKALKNFGNLNIPLFIVSNQPDYAKGKTSISNLIAVHNTIYDYLAGSGIRINEFFYCFHHPDGVAEGYSCICDCRKPQTGFLITAKQKFSLDLSSSWMIGDRESDIKFGLNGGLKTIYLKRKDSFYLLKDSVPDYTSGCLESAFEIIKMNI